MQLPDGNHLLEIRIFCPTDHITTVYVLIQEDDAPRGQWHSRSFACGLLDLPEGLDDPTNWPVGAPPP